MLTMFYRNLPCRLAVICALLSSHLAAANPSADLNGDGWVDYRDFALMASQWLMPGTLPGPEPILFVDIPGGRFEMGDHYDVGWPDEKPVHTVVLDAFKMSKHEITNAQYVNYLNAALADGLVQIISGVVYASFDESGAEPYCDTASADDDSQIEYSQGQFVARSRDGLSMANHPVVEVSFYGAQAFCDYHGYRLPTEAEWEYAARGGYHDPYYQYPWGGNTIDCSRANYYGSRHCNPLDLTDYPYTSPVGYHQPQGAYGLCDMSGNVWEWCQDWYSTWYYDVSPTLNPTGPSAGSAHVLRGGGWYLYGYNTYRIAKRVYGNPDYRGYSVGFRVCVSADTADEP